MLLHVACRRSVGPRLRQLHVRDDVVDADEDSNCCSLMDVSTAASISVRHATAAVSQIDTGYQSNIMQTTGSLSATTSIAGVHRQHLTVDNVNCLDATDDL